MTTPPISRRSVFEAALESACASLSITLTAGQIDKFWSHFERVLEANARFNLTRITDAADAAVRHYADSLSLLTWPPARGPDIRRVLDVGTGAGYPAVPLAIVRPDWQVIAVDSTGKKVDFVAAAAEQLSLSNLNVRKHRAGERLPDEEPVDLVLFRAVAKLTDCLKNVQDLVRRGGVVVCYKSADLPPAEWSAAQRFLTKGSYTLSAQVPVLLHGAGKTLRRQLVCYRRA